MPRRAGSRGCAAGARRTVIGVNIGKSRIVEVDDAIADYVAQRDAARAARRLPRRERQLAEHAGAARPAGGRDARAAAARGARRPPGATPLLVKIAPDLADEEVRRDRAARGRAGPRRHHRDEHDDLPRRA